MLHHSVDHKLIIFYQKVVFLGSANPNQLMNDINSSIMFSWEFIDMSDIILVNNRYQYSIKIKILTFYLSIITQK